MNQRSLFLLAGFGALLVSACGGGSTSRNSSGVSGFTVLEVSNGFGKLLPHRIPIKDAAGLPTGTVIEITSLQDLTNNVTLTNPILPPVQWKTTAELPNAEPGNHFIYARFSQPLRIDSILSSAPASGAPNNLTGNIQVVTVDPMNGNTVPIEGRGFIGGRTFGAFSNPPNFQLETWVTLDANGKPVASTLAGGQPGLGFPGTEGTGFAGANLLVDDSTFVFVVDDDANLATHDTFPTGFQIQMKITEGVLSSTGRPLSSEAVASSTVGPDTIPPEVLVAGAALTPVIVPGNGEIGVDPQTAIEVFFTEPVQILRVGRLDDGTIPALSAAIQLQFGPSTGKVSVPFFVDVISVFDLTHLSLRPVYAFPGAGPAGVAACGDLSMIDVIVNRGQIADLASTATPNLNTLSPSTFFQTGEGPGIVNAPVTPDTIYVGRGGSEQGISVVDLNGFGLGTGNPTYDITRPIQKGNSNAPNNPNLQVQGALLSPPIQQGTCTTNGGSEGIFSLTKDSSLNDMLVTPPIIESTGDMALGHSLDIAFNNGSPFGCQSGGGNICAWTGLKNVSIGVAGSSILPLNIVTTIVFTPLKTEFGGENLASWSPHPNPPPLTFPPLCLSPLLGGQEPTAYYITLPPPPVNIGLGLRNLLAPGDAFGDPSRGIPPTGLLARTQNTYFEGPSPPQQTISTCQEYMQRQQIGQFLYMVDRAAGEIVVFNSNRFTVLDRIPLPDPTSLAMSPNLDLLAVTNQRADQVSFVNVDPNSFQFHQVVKTVVVGRGPIGIAWAPDNEDILVANQRDNTMSIISAFNLEVRKVVRNQLSSPFEIAITPRMNGFSFQRGVYFAYILNGDGSVAIFESGPDGINGWGFDDVIGRVPFTFQNPKTIAADPTTMNSQFWVAHEGQLDLFTGQPNGRSGGAVTQCGIKSAITGQILIDTNLLGRPQIRDLEYGIFGSIGSDVLTGVPVDIAFDNLANVAGVTNISNPFSAGTPLSLNGKALLKSLTAFNVIQATTPEYLFLAIPNSFEGPGVVEVIGLRTGLQRVDTDRFTPGIQSIPAPNVRTVMDYFRQ
jgi:hypothetical protein